MKKYIDTDIYNIIIGERSNGKIAVEKELVKKAKIVKDIKEALAKISSNAHNGLQSIKKGNSMEAYYHGQLTVIDIIEYIINNDEQAEVQNEN